MLKAKKILDVARTRGEKGQELNRVHRMIREPELLLLAYDKIASNKGRLTPGTNPNDKMDGLSLQRINHIAEQLQQGTFQWTPVRRIYIDKGKGNGRQRPLGLPNFTDKLVQAAMQLVLESYYEPQFSKHSHGFRPNRGCHTALNEVVDEWTGTVWFIEGDIKGCFDHIDHELLINILGRKIKDTRFLELIRDMLEAGYMENWRYNQTYSGTPQGGTLSPLLANIFLHELDKFIEEELVPQYNKGKSRNPNPVYKRTKSRIETLRRRTQKPVNPKELRALQKQLFSLPSMETHDPEYRRLRYIRYADDFILGFVGPREEAITIKHRIREFLTWLKLELTEEKTLITHARTGKARFLNFEVYTAQENSKRYHGRRTLNGNILLRIPQDVMTKWRRKVCPGGTPVHRTELLHYSDYDIVMNYQVEFQGLVNYYTIALNVGTLYTIKGAWTASLVKTLAAKHKRKTGWVYAKYKSISTFGITTIKVVVPREGKKPLIAEFGPKPIHYQRTIPNIEDERQWLRYNRTQLLDRLLAETCELCGSQDNVQVHHIKSIKDLSRRNRGKKERPAWMVRMIELHRNTLVVCETCHRQIHQGTYDGHKLA